MSNKKPHNYTVSYDDDGALTLEAYKAMREESDEVAVYAKRDRGRGKPEA